jgi:hypothetical protein
MPKKNRREATKEGPLTAEVRTVKKQALED